MYSSQKQKIKGLLISILFFSTLFAGGSAFAQMEYPHAATNPEIAVDCADCHAQHWAQTAVPNPSISAPQLVYRWDDQYYVCRSCHYPGGPGETASGGGTGISLHQNADGTVRHADCGTCHNPHVSEVSYDSHSGKSAKNVDLIRADISGLFPGASTPVVFQKNPDDFSFDSGDFNGICQTCHTGTSHHRRDGTDPDHMKSVSCTVCHLHDNGFIATDDCLTCHLTDQTKGSGPPTPGRRAVIDEFTDCGPSSHSHCGDSLSSETCVICHELGTHSDGSVELLDADDGSIYRFSQTTDFDADPDLSDFCAGCHDDNGATRLAAPLDPFGNGNTPPDVATQFKGTLQWNEWYGDYCFGSEGTLRGVNSHHDISDADQAFSGAKIECLNCHGAHIPTLAKPLAYPYSTTTVWEWDTNSFCITCHSGENGPTDALFPTGVSGPDVALRGLQSCDYMISPWWVSYTWTGAAHGIDSKRGWPGYTGATGYELNCTDCHDPHGSYTPTNTAGNPYMIRDVIDGTGYIDDRYRTSPNGPPYTTYGTAKNVVVSISGGNVSWANACVTCHADWINSYSWHSWCTGCQTCHGHGQDYQNNDWGSGVQDSVACQSCGNSVVQSPVEECDDGNRTNGDGCSNECTIE